MSSFLTAYQHTIGSAVGLGLKVGGNDVTVVDVCAVSRRPFSSSQLPVSTSIRTTWLSTRTRAWFTGATPRVV